MKAILKFNLPDDEYEFNTAVKAGDWRNVCWDFDQMLRAEIKYNEKLSECEYEVLTNLRSKFNDILNEHNLEL